jgi:hypothetical protein
MSDRGFPSTWRRFMAWVGALGTACLAGAPAAALDYQVHGYAAQGYVLSNGNNVFGDSTNGGSLDYYEAGINGSVQVIESLRFAAQAAIRGAGATDTGSPRLDYYLADYRPFATDHADAGLRIGKVKTPLGLFSETRDVVFTRPGILLPSLYDDSQGTRNLLFASPGLQAYGDLVERDHDLSLTATVSRNRSLSQSEQRLLINLDGLPFQLRVSQSWNAQLMDSIDGGRWQFAYSHFYGRFDLDTAPQTALFGTFGASIDVLSARFNADRVSLTAEYARNPNRDRVTIGGVPLLTSDLAGDSAYIQGDYRFNSAWGAMLRLDSTFRDQSDRSGRRFAAANPGADPESRFPYDVTLGGNWRFAEAWRAWAEYHYITGTATVQPLDNVGRTPVDHWSLLLLMLGYRF